MLLHVAFEFIAYHIFSNLTMTNLTFFYFHQCGSSEARKSLNRPVAQELFNNLIYNHSPTFYAKEG